MKNGNSKIFNKTTLSIAICMTSLFAHSTVSATCVSNGNTNGVVTASNGSNCSVSGTSYSGNNVVAAYGENSVLSFSAPTVTITSNFASTYALSVGGMNSHGVPVSPGATINANNLQIVSSPASPSRGIFIYGSDINKKDTLNVNNDLEVTHRAPGGAAVDLSGKGSVLVVGQNTIINSAQSNGLRNNGQVTIGGNLNSTTRGIGISNTGEITIHGQTTLVSSSGTAINNINNGVITFQKNVTSTGEETSINNDASTINFFGTVNQFAGNVINTNSGLLNLSNNQLSNLLTIDGNYSGSNGVINIDTQLNADNSPTDFITIKGDAKGSTQLKVNNVGGNGAQTINGIHVIQTGTSESDRTFYLKNSYISAGAYDYGLNLKKANTGTNSSNYDNWYLESTLRDREDIDIPVYTPDVGSYLVAEVMGNTLFTSRLEDREGASHFQSLEKDNGNVWVRAYGGHHQFKSMSEQLSTKGNSLVTQIGAGLVTLGTEDQYNLGVMGGYARYSGTTKSVLTDRTSKAAIDGYSVGLYGTWFAHPVEKRGAYIDSWVLWNSFSNKIDTADQNNYKYDSSGITASIEVGGDYLINKNGNKNWWIQPQSQIIYQGVHADNFKDAQGVNIGHGSDNLQARLGFKTYLETSSTVGPLTTYRPYIALNYIHNTSPYSVNIDNIEHTIQGASNLGEVKVGVEGHITKNSQIWLNASYVTGNHDNRTYQGNIGWKYNF